MTHTIGKMTVGGNVMDDCIKIGDELIGVIYPCEPEREGEALANARRLAACWNACEGLSTDLLVAMDGSYKTAVDGFHTQGMLRMQMQQERDALLTALERVCAAWPKVGGDGDPYGVWMNSAIEEAQTAIAAANGGAQ